MGTTAQKLTYLSGTKDRLKATINYAGAGLTNETFRQYPEKLYDKYLDILKDNGEALFNGLPKVTGTDTSLSLNNTASTRMALSLAPSELSQDGTPTPESPQDIHTISGNNEIKVEGSNLFDINTLDGSANMTISNGKLILAGSTAYHVTNVGVNLKDIANLKAGETYYLNYKTTYTGSDYNKLYLRGSTSYWVNGTSHTITQSELDDRIAFYGTNNSEISELIISKENIDYEPYISQETDINLGTLEVCKIGDYADEFIIPSGNNIIKGLISGSRAWGDGVIGDNEYYSRTDYIEVKPNTAYYIQHGISSGKGYTIWCYDSNKTTLGSVNLSGSSFDASGTVTTLANTKYIIANFYNETINTNPPMLNEGLTALPYEPYNNGKWYLKKNVGKVVLDGSENSWILNGNYFETPTISSLAITTVYSNIAAYITIGGLSANTNNRIAPYQNRCWLRVSQFNNNLDTFKTFLQTTNLIIYYVLSTPIYTLLNDTLQEELNNIKKALSYDTQTNISQTNNDLPFVISASAVKKYELNN